MQPAQDTDYKTLFSQLIKKQMLVLGPDITLAKVKNVIGLTVDVNGDVIKIEGDPQQMLQMLINQFVELSGMIVKKTMESILTSYPGMMAMATSAAFGGPIATAQTSTTPTVSAQTTEPTAADPSVKLAMADAAQSTTAQTNPARIVSQSDAGGPAEINTPEPPSMTSMNLESVNIGAPDPKKSEPQVEQPASFSNQEMNDLNKALEELSKAPLSTEQKPA